MFEMTGWFRYLRLAIIRREAAEIRTRMLTHLAAAALFVCALIVAPSAFAQGPAGRLQIPSRSMAPTLLSGMTVSAVKYAHNALPARGDIIAFRVPANPKMTFVFRVVGLPGERVQMIDGLLHINGEGVKREQLDDFVYDDDGKASRVKRWRETLPNGVAHETIDLTDNGPLDDTAIFTVPAGSLFVLGDNRDNAQDSRLATTGFIPLQNVIGRIEPAAKGGG